MDWTAGNGIYTLTSVSEMEICLRSVSGGTVFGKFKYSVAVRPIYLINLVVVLKFWRNQVFSIELTGAKSPFAIEDDRDHILNYYSFLFVYVFFRFSLLITRRSHKFGVISRFPYVIDSKIFRS